MRKSTKERVYDYMKEFGSITGLEAFRDLGTFSLREAIRDLKRDGINISSKYETSVNRWGTKTNYKRYSLEGDE
jgi:hypothetical protein